MSNSGKLTIGTRGSKLALVQAETVRDALLRLFPDLDVRLEVITTKGDAIQDRPLSQIGGNGVFVRQIELALLDGTINAAVHSAKDLPSTLSPGTVIAAYLPRADVRDVLISNDGITLETLPTGARVGTSSPRRICQLRAIRPDITLLDIRGNVDTRLRKLREGHYDAIVLAAAGLQRLQRQGEITEWLDPVTLIPAPAQGALAVEVRDDDNSVTNLLRSLNDPPTCTSITAERAFLKRVGGSCALPIAAYATLSSDTITLQAMIGTLDGRAVRGELSGPQSDPAALGTALAEQLLSSGGDTFIALDMQAEAQA